jgi:CheY-like chemotaxis protein
VSLPARLDEFVQDDAAHESRPVGEARPLQGIRVLIVDDDDDTREILGVMLSEEGASVVPAASAGEALVHLQAEPPHVLISDIGMPLEDGYALLRRVRALPPERGGDVPAIALTAYARREDAHAAESAGFQLHVAKPIRPEQLLHAVQSCVRARSGDAP